MTGSVVGFDVVAHGLGSNTLDTDPGLEGRRVDSSAVADSGSHEWRLVNHRGHVPNASRGPGDAGAQAPNAVLSSNQCAVLGE